MTEKSEVIHFLVMHFTQHCLLVSNSSDNIQKEHSHNVASNIYIRQTSWVYNDIRVSKWFIFEWSIPLIWLNMLGSSHQSPTNRHQNVPEGHEAQRIPWLTLLWNRSCCLGQVVRAQSVDLWHYLHQRHPCWPLQQGPALTPASVAGYTYGPCGALQCCHCRSWSSQCWS